MFDRVLKFCTEFTSAICYSWFANVKDTNID